MLIKLTKKIDASPVYINSDKIISFFESSLEPNVTLINTGETTFIKVLNSPEEIMNLLNKKKEENETN